MGFPSRIFPAIKPASKLAEQPPGFFMAVLLLLHRESNLIEFSQAGKTYSLHARVQRGIRTGKEGNSSRRARFIDNPQLHFISHEPLYVAFAQAQFTRWIALQPHDQHPP